MVFINKSGHVRVPALAYQWIPPRNDIFNFWLFSSLFLTCMGWSCRWDLHISPLSLSLSISLSPALQLGLCTLLAAGLTSFCLRSGRRGGQRRHPRWRAAARVWWCGSPPRMPSPTLWSDLQNEYHQEMIFSISDLYGYNIYYMGGELSLRSSHFTTFSILMIKI